jgi:hypothetical protein
MLMAVSPLHCWRSGGKVLTLQGETNFAKALFALLSKLIFPQPAVS